MLPVPVTYCNARWHASLYHMTVEVSVFCVLGVSYRSPHLFVSTVEGRLYRGSVDHHTAGNIYVVCFVMMSPPGSTCMDVEGADRRTEPHINLLLVKIRPSCRGSRMLAQLTTNQL